MLELLGVFYLAYSTYRITKVVSVPRAVLWFMGTLLFYFIFVYGLTFGITVVLAVLQVPSLPILSMVGTVLLVGFAILIIHLVQDRLEDQVRIDQKSRRDSLRRKEQQTQLSQYRGQYVSLNYDKERSAITRQRSALPNGSSLLIKYNESESYFQNEVTVVGAEFQVVHDTTRYRFTLAGRLLDEGIEIRGTVLHKETGDQIPISDTLRPVAPSGPTAIQ